MGYSFAKICSNVIPTGSYKVEISDIKFKTGSDGAMTNNMEVHYTVIEGAQAKKTLIDTIYENAFSFRLKPFLNAVGIDINREFNSARELYDYGIREAKGKVLMLDVGIRVYNGNEYNQVKAFAPVPSSTTTVDDVLSEFGIAPEVMPEKPRVSDIPDIDGGEAPVAEVSDDDTDLF